MLCNVKCAARKIRITFCGKILCKSVKLAEPPDAEPHVRWCERSAAKAASYSIKICTALGVTLSQFFQEGNSENLTEDQKEVLRIWNDLSTNEQETVMSILHGLRK